MLTSHKILSNDIQKISAIPDTSVKMEYDAFRLDGNIPADFDQGLMFVVFCIQ